MTADSSSTVAGSNLLNPVGFTANPLVGAPAAAKITGTGATLLPDADAVGTGTNCNVTITANNSTDQITIGGTANAARFGIQNCSNGASRRWVTFPSLSSRRSCIGDVAGSFMGRRRSGPEASGCYEAELHPAIAQAIARDPRKIINIGCAEGYYAVGTARALPQARVYAFDTSTKAQQICGRAGAANHVAGRARPAAVLGAGAFSPQARLQVHKFFEMQGHVLKPYVVRGDVHAPLSQVFWADVVFIKDITRLDRVSPEQLLKLAIILHYVYNSVDVAHLVIGAYDRVTHADLAPAYEALVVSPSKQGA